MANEFERFVGHRASFRLLEDNSVLSGTIQNIDKSNATITFYRVTIEDSPKKEECGKVFKGLQHYHVSEIQKLDISSEVNKFCLKKEATVCNQNEKSILHNKTLPYHLHYLKNLESSDLLMKQVVDQEIGITKGKEGEYDSSLPSNCTLLDDCNSQIFKDAIAHLKKCSNLGVTFKGIQLGRNGSLCWILMSTKEHTMFFDVQTMGKECFRAGIQDILESPDIQKVIHDCRLPSDLLHHQYNTKLVNIFDTQVAAVYIYKLQHQNDFPRYVFSLPECLQNELGIGLDHLPFLLIRDHCPEKDEEVWSYRPTPTLVYDWMLKHNCYLMDLQQKQMEEMLMEFTMGVDIYLQNMRDANDSDAEMRQSRHHLLPTEFLGLPVELQALYRERQLKKKVSLKYTAAAKKDENNLIENCTGVLNPRVIANNDAVWHFTGTLKSDVKPSSPKGSAANSTVNTNSSLSSPPFSVEPTSSVRSSVEVKESDRVSPVLAEQKYASLELKLLGKDFGNIILRPAGEMLQTQSQRKEKKPKIIRPTETNEVIDQSLTPSSESMGLTDSEFDAIPSQCKVNKPCLLSDTSINVSLLESSEAFDSYGFKIDRFTEIAPPPPFMNNGNSLDSASCVMPVTTMKQSYTENSRPQSSSSVALAAVLPQVENPSLLHSGFRLSSHRKKFSSLLS